MVSKRVEQKGDLSRAVSKRRGVLLFSGGLDSTLSAITLLNQGTDLIALTIDYPSRPRREDYAARQLAQRLPFSNFIQVNLDTGGPLMKCGRTHEAEGGWIPYRNLLLYLFTSLRAS